MIPTPLHQIARLMNAHVVGEHPETTITGICTDSRHARPGDLFFALQGEKADGHQFVEGALAAGASAAVVGQHWLEQAKPQQGTYIPTLDPLAALGKWAQAWRKNFDIPVVGVTGSAGKTTTRQMIGAALESHLPALVSKGNFNTEIGVPQTLLDLTPEHHAAVIEMAMRGAGQISYLCQISLPSAGVITNIGQSHLELLGSRKNIAYAKAELLESLPQGGWSVLPADDDFFDLLVESAQGPVITFGLSDSADYRAEQIELRNDGCASFVLQTSAGAQKVDLQAPGRFHVLNACAAAAVARRFGVPLPDIAAALSGYSGFEKRSRIFASKRGWTVYDDTYNAGPSAAIGAVEALAAMEAAGRRIAVLGDMMELGEAWEQAHKDLGEAVAAAGVDLLVTVGQLAPVVAEAALAVGFGGTTAHFTTASEASDYLAGELEAGDVVLVKGSRALAMEGIVESIA